MNNRFEMPIMVSAKDLQAMGFGRGMAYRLLRGDIIPVVTIGKRKFIRNSTLLDWIEMQENKNNTSDTSDKCDRSDESEVTV